MSFILALGHLWTFLLPDYLNKMGKMLIIVEIGGLYVSVCLKIFIIKSKKIILKKKEITKRKYEGFVRKELKGK